MTKRKAADEVFCRSCGEAIKQASELCPNCGVRNDNYSPASSGGGRSSVHDPAQYETSVSDTWWYGVAAGTGVWVLLVLASALGGDLGAGGGILVLIGWAGLPLSVYFDTQYVRANSEWDPNVAVWVILSAIWFLNIAAGAAYLYRRHQVLGEP
ncbi:zinc ribbon domain-containing protein [Halobaculum roseum]|uniref:Zinc ribbon domain-containing protein n=1 Tax=Halobaculum roseum TaxID=2175149 RepID=A0ABD5MNC7_9EURY|nr:zinc ribbon domain-containing protein [Halobaculum roseum]QZY01687.1 zinc ribbon domain-containing protein [Halobaculum roseum]